MARYVVTLWAAGGPLTVDHASQAEALTEARNHVAFWAEPAEVSEPDTGNRWEVLPDGEVIEHRSPWDIRQTALTFG